MDPNNRNRCSNNHNRTFPILLFPMGISIKMEKQ